MSYNASAQLITKPVSIRDVQRAIGVSSPDLGTLASHANINWWARFKPVRVEQIPPITYVQNAINVHFGLDIIHFYGKKSAFGQLIANYATFEFGSSVNGQYKGWKNGVFYQPPSSFFRLTDFICKENPSVFGYKHNAQILWNQPGTTYAISSAIGDGAEIDLAEMPDYQEIGESEYHDNRIFNDTNLNVDMSLQTNAAYGSISVPEILKAHGYAGGGFRGVVLTDGFGGVAYISIDSIPWREWATNVQEAILFGRWRYLEFYTNANPAGADPTGDYYLIPGLMGTCYITTGSGGQGGIQFYPSPDNGIVSYSSTLMKYVTHVEFARMDGQQVSEWNLTVIVRKVYSDGTTSAAYYTNDIENIPNYPSGYTWYYFDFGIDLGTIDNYGDTFELVIQGTRKNISEATRVVHRSRFVLTR